jgi:hypothetical protein
MEAGPELRYRQKQISEGQLHPYEPLFTIRAQDAMSCGIVRMWCEMAKLNGVPEEKIQEAYELADKMKVWPKKRIPGRPDTLVVAPAVCRFCERPATCYGTYDHDTGYACSECCGHGNEDGFCRLLEDQPIN